MNLQDIIRMASEVGMRPNMTEALISELVHFAALVARAEREACARECEIQALDGVFAPDDLADAIRARGSR